MKPLLTALVLLMAAGAASAQETRVEKTNPAPSPQQDAKENSPDVPDVYAVTGKFERVVVLRFKYRADLLAGLERMVREQHIKNGVILSAVGSVRGYHLHSVSNRTFPSKDMFVENPTGPADIVSMNGYVMNGRLHPHITLADSRHAFGGHLEPGTTVFTFAIVTIGVLDDGVNFDRLDDKTYR
ncbi:MAG TPA: PPC domain-containing DNA-binding protein [Opitutaceae bacterium]|nr:PPC domain-containing DNA-binding protein [Opitutaceae bacterium]